MAENLQEKLEQRFQKNEKVTVSEVSDAYTQTRENRLKEYIAGGGSNEKFEQDQKDFLDGAKQLRDKQLERVAALGVTLEQKKTEVIDVTKNAERNTKYLAARSYGWSKTDPDAPGSDDTGLPDYEGTGKDDKMGPGRTMLAGYMVALQFHDPKMASSVFAKAREIYEKSDEGIWNVDKYLSDQKIRELIGQFYLDQFLQFDLSNECKGLLGGYMKISESSLQNPAEREAYKTYLVSEVGKLNASGSLTYQPKPDQDKLDIDDSKATLQLNAFEALLTAKEWQEQLASLRASFDTFKKSCDGIVNAYPDFKFQDAAITQILSKTPDTFSFQDKAALDAARDQAAKEFWGYVQKKKQDIGGEIDDNKKKVSTLKDSNKALKYGPISDDDWKAIDGAMDQLGKDLDAVIIPPNTGFEELTAKSSRLQQARDANNLMKAKLEDTEKKIKDVQEKEPLILKFLDEKCLAEKRDGAGAVLALNEDGLKTEGKNVSLEFKNSDAQKIFGDKAKAMLPGKKDVVERLIAQAKQDSTFSFDHLPSPDELQKAYTEKFVPAWEKAAKDLDTAPAATVGSFGGSGGLGGQTTSETPSGVVGGGFLGNIGKDNPTDNVDTNADAILDHWNNGKNVPMPEDLRGFAGGLQVKNVQGFYLRDDVSHMRAIQLDPRTGAKTNELTLAEPNGGAWEVDGNKYVKVNYQGRAYYGAANFLERNEASKRVPEQPQVFPQVEVQNGPRENPDLAFLGKVNNEYRDALERVLRDSEKPGGALFDLYFNKRVLPCRLEKTPQNFYVIKWEGGGSPAFANVRQVMEAINSGSVLQGITMSALLSKNYYAPYEDLIDGFKEDLKPTEKPGEVYFELNWKGSGQGEGNAMVWATAYPHGQIAYRIRRNHAAGDGSNQRDGMAANFDDFMKQIGHTKNWSENYEANRDDKKLTQQAVNREFFFSQISDPRFFYDQEAVIGRPVSFDIFNNETVQMYLDWGGGASRDFMKNPMLNFWADPRTGRINYIVNFKGRGFTQQGNVGNIGELLGVIAQIKGKIAEAPAGALAKASVPIETKVIATDVTSSLAEPGGKWPKETAEQKEDRNRLADDVKKKLLMLTEDDAKLEASGYSVSKLLDESAALLETLKTKYPYDPDIFVLGKAYEDLRKDFTEHRETDLDQAFEPILKEMRQEMLRAGVRKISMDNLREVRSQPLLRTVERLQGLNIKPSYVVESPNPNAKTVVLFMQTHPEPKIDKSKIQVGQSSGNDSIGEAVLHPDRGLRSVESSQGQIRDSIIAATRAGLIHCVYEEGLPKGFELPKIPQITEEELPGIIARVQKEGPEELAQALQTGSLQAKLILGSALQLKGYDFDELKMKLLDNKADFIYRMHAHNAFIASNISDYVESSPDDVSFLTIGALHEAYPNSKVEHHLPLSHAMAYYGMNVVVVDSTFTPPVS